MISVVIYINNHPIYLRGAVNITKDFYNKTDEDIHEYRVDDGTIIRQKRSDGAIKLAIKMLKTIKEIGK